MQTHTAGLNITPAGMWLAVLCYTSNHYNKKSSPSSLSLHPCLHLISSPASPAPSPFSLHLALIEVSIWLPCALYSSQGRDCIAQQFPSRFTLCTNTHRCTQAEQFVCVCVWRSAGFSVPSGLSLAGAVSPLVTWELLVWISVCLTGYKQGTALDSHTPGSSAHSTAELDTYIFPLSQQ